jgi:DNA-binding CsgD family transcriptional regulator
MRDHCLALEDNSALCRLIGRRILSSAGPTPAASHSGAFSVRGPKRRASSPGMAHAGRSTLAPEATDVLVRAARQKAIRPDYGLTDREEEVLSLLAEGLTNAEVAERLVISVSTAKFHEGSILAKLGVATRTEAAALAWQQNLVQNRQVPQDH